MARCRLDGQALGSKDRQGDKRQSKLHVCKECWLRKSVVSLMRNRGRGSDSVVEGWCQDQSFEHSSKGLYMLSSALVSLLVESNQSSSALVAYDGSGPTYVAVDRSASHREKQHLRCLRMPCAPDTDCLVASDCGTEPADSIPRLRKASDVTPPPAFAPDRTPRMPRCNLGHILHPVRGYVSSQDHAGVYWPCINRRNASIEATAPSRRSDLHSSRRRSPVRLHAPPPALTPQRGKGESETLLSENLIRLGA